MDQPRIRMVSSSTRARSAYPLHIRPITFIVRRAGEAFGYNVQAPTDVDTTVLGCDRPDALDGAHEGSEPTVDVVEDVRIAVRWIDRGDRLVQAAAVSEAERTRLADSAPVVWLPGHLAYRWEGGVAPREDFGRPGRHQTLESNGGIHGDGSRRLDAVTGHGRKATRWTPRRCAAWYVRWSLLV